MTSTDLEQRVADAIKRAKVSNYWNDDRPVSNLLLSDKQIARAAIAAVFDALPEMVTDDIARAYINGTMDHVCDDRYRCCEKDGLRSALTALKGHNA